MKRCRVIIAMLCLTLVFATSVPVYAEDSIQSTSSRSVYHDAEKKQLFAKQKYEEYINQKEQENILDYNDEKIIELISDAACATELEKEVITQQLELFGVYEFPTETVITDGINLLADSSDVTVNSPNIYYNSSTDKWYVSTGGAWTTENYDDNIIITDLNVGGADGFGVAYSNASGYKSSVVQVSASLFSEESGSVTTTNRSDGDGGAGFGFRLQDKYVNVGFAQYDYIGYKWSGVCCYDSDFASFSATATSYYIHTYDSAYIQSIKFSVSGNKANLEIVIANNSDSFVAYSNDTKKTAS